jgi:hypothetical protein
MLSVNGDFDGDGYDDLAVGSPLESVGDISQAGAVTIIYGSRKGLIEQRNQTFTLATPGVNGVPSTQAWFGTALAIGDFNGDGRDDLAIGTILQDVDGQEDAGQVNVLYGSASGLRAGSVDQLFTQNSPGINDTAETRDQFGDGLAAGDFNGDGRDDLAIGAVRESIGTIQEAGLVHVLFGGSQGLRTDND